MDKYYDVVLQAINAGMTGDAEALWVAKLLLTASLTPQPDTDYHSAKARH